MAAKDMRNNLKKVEQCYHDHPFNSSTSDVRTLLLQEQATGVHDIDPHGHPVLAESSGAMGLLWIRRSLSFQCRFYRYLTEQPDDAPRAALQAYDETLRNVHGWTLQRVHVLGMQSATPERRALLARLGGLSGSGPAGSLTVAQEQAVEHDLRALVQVWEPLLHRWEEIFDELNLEDRRRA